MNTKLAFRVHFNHGKQWFDVYIDDNARKFMKREKCWAYYQSTRDRYQRRGYFGSVHFSRAGVGLVSHELLHLWIDWIRCRKNGIITAENEERLVTMFGEMSRVFWKKYYSWKEHTNI